MQSSRLSGVTSIAAGDSDTDWRRALPVLLQRDQPGPLPAEPRPFHLLAVDREARLKPFAAPGEDVLLELPHELEISRLYALLANPPIHFPRTDLHSPADSPMRWAALS